MKIDHIGYLVKDINKAISKFEALGFSLCSPITHDELRKTDICFMINGGYKIELISPYSEESVVANLIKTYKNSPYHICYQTKDIDVDVHQLEKNGFTMMQSKQPAPAFGNKNVVFLFSSKIGIIELVEE